MFILPFCYCRLLVEQLERVDVSVLESSVKLAFWINIYNSLIMHVNLIFYKLINLSIYVLDVICI